MSRCCEHPRQAPRRIKAVLTSSTASPELDREFHLGTYGGCPIEQLTATVVRLWNATQHYRRAFMALTGPGRMWVVNAEHRLLLDAVRRRDEVDAGRFLAGHIRRTRIELSHHPAVFGGLP